MTWTRLADLHAAAALIVLTLAAPALQEPQARDAGPGQLSDALYPGAVPNDARERPTHAVVRIVDALDGSLLREARVHAVQESQTPLTGVFWSSRTVSVDADGFARIRLDDLEPNGLWLYFEAAGYATRASMHEDEPVVRLERASELEVEVLDAWGRPAAGALLGRLVGCGHTPDAVTWTTDARGRARLRGVSPGNNELWPAASGSGSHYLDAPGWRAAEEPQVLRLQPGAVMEGVVVDRDGRPVPGVYVGQPHLHRGPWCQADDAGRFRLLGASARWLHLRKQGDPRVEQVEVDSAGGPVRIVIPAAPEPAAASVVVRTRTPGAGDALGGVHVAAVNLESRLYSSTRTDPDGSAQLRLPAGEYELSARHDEGGYGLTRRIRVGPGLEEIEFDLELQESPHPELVLRNAHTLPEDVDVTILASDHQQDVTKGLRDGAREHSFPVPAEGALAVRVQWEERVRMFHVEHSAGTPLPVELHAPAATRVRARVLGPDGGVPALAAISDRPLLELDVEAPVSSDERGQLELRSAMLGRAWLLVQPRSEELELVCVPLSLREGQDLLDLGNVQVRARAASALTVLHADGTPAAGAELSLTRGPESGQWALDGRGALAGGVVPRAGDRVVVQGLESCLPLRATLAGEGPWTLRFPAATLAIEALDEHGAPLREWVALLDGEPCTFGAAPVQLQGVPAGKHQLVVASLGRRARVFDLEIASGEHVRARALLPLRKE